MKKKFDKANVERYIHNTGIVGMESNYRIFADEACVFLREIQKDPLEGITLLYLYGFAKGKRAQAAAQRKAGV